MERHTTLERVVAQRAKEKFIKDSDFNPSVNGQKVKAKARARKNMQEKGTTTRTRLDLQMKMDSVKSTFPTTENWVRKLCTCNMKYNMSDEDNKHDTKLHQQAQVHEPRHAQAAPVSTARRARSLRCTLLDVVSHAPHGSRCS